MMGNAVMDDIIYRRNEFNLQIPCQNESFMHHLAALCVATDLQRYFSPIRI